MHDDSDRSFSVVEVLQSYCIRVIVWFLRFFLPVIALAMFAPHVALADSPHHTPPAWLPQVTSGRARWQSYAVPNLAQGRRVVDTIAWGKQPGTAKSYVALWRDDAFVTAFPRKDAASYAARIAYEKCVRCGLNPVQALKVMAAGSNVLGRVVAGVASVPARILVPLSTQTTSRNGCVVNGRYVCTKQ